MHRSGLALRSVAFALFALVLLVPVGLVGGCGHTVESPIPTGQGVSPDLVCNAEPADMSLTQITIKGDHFTPMPEKTLEDKRELLLPQVQLIGGTALPVTGAMAPSDFTFPDDPAMPAASSLHWDSEQQMRADIRPGDMIPPGVFSIKVTNPDKKSSVTLSNVIGVFPPPSIAQIQPPTICDAESDQTITVTGTYFLVYDGANPTVTVGDKTFAATADPNSCMPVTGNFTEMNVKLCTTLTFVIPKGTFAVTTAMQFPVTVTNPPPANCESSEPIMLTIEPPPRVDDVMPANVCEGGKTVTIHGANFVSGAKVNLDCMQGEMLSASNVTVTPDGTTISATFGPGAVVGDTCQVIVTNPDGCTDLPLPHKTVGVLSGPILFFVTPDVVYNGINTRITLYATTITPPATVSIAPSGGGAPIQLMSQAVTGHPNRWEAIVPTGTPPGQYDVILQDGTPCPGILPKGLTVTNTLNVSLDSIVPAFGNTADDTGVTIYRNASAAAPMNDAFKPTPRVFLNPSNDPTAVATEVTGVSFVDQSTVNGVVPKGTPVLKYDVVLVNPDGGVGLLKGAYTEINGQPPVVDSATPASLVANASNPNNVVLTGQGFASGDMVSIRCEDSMGNPVTAPTVTSQGTPTCSGASCSQTIAVSGSGLQAGEVCVVRVTNPDGSYGDFSALGVVNGSGNLTPMVAGPNMNVARRALVAGSGPATNTARFIYAIGGDNGTPAGALDSVEFAPVDLFGKIGAFTVDPVKLTAKRTLAGATTIGRYIYVVGGNDGTGPVASGSRALILSPNEAPIIEDVDLALGMKGLGAGEWSYRVSALFAAGDPDNPGGESLPSDEFSMKLPMIGSKLVTVTLTWKAPVDSLGQPLTVTGYNIYRTPVNGAPGSEVLIGTAPGATLTFTDDGTAMPGTQTPLPQGSTGQWAALPALGLGPREAHGVAYAADPTTPNTFYVYALLGRNAGGLLGSYEFLKVTTAPNGRQTVGTWTAGSAAAPTPRDEVGVWVATSQTDAMIGPSSYVYVGPGSTATTTGVGQVKTGGDLGTWDESLKTLTSADSGYGVCSANGFLYLFGGQTASGPSTKEDSAQIANPPPALVNFGSMGAAMLTQPRYLMGNTVESANVYLLGGQSMKAPANATNTTEHVVW